MGGSQITVAVVSDMMTTSTISTIPGAVKCETNNKIQLQEIIFIPASCVLPDTSLLGSLVPAPLVAVMVTVISWYGLSPVML